jgi:hypothetical protein
VSAYPASIVAPSDAGATSAGALEAAAKLMRFGAAALDLDFVAFFFADDLANCGLLKLKVSRALSAYKNRLLESDWIGNDAPICVRKTCTYRKNDCCLMRRLTARLTRIAATAGTNNQRKHRVTRPRHRGEKDSPDNHDHLPRRRHFEKQPLVGKLLIYLQTLT